MGARHKLNVSYFNGAMFVAAIAGLLAGSWPVFIVIAVIGIVASVYLKEIRL